MDLDQRVKTESFRTSLVCGEEEDDHRRGSGEEVPDKHKQVRNVSRETSTSDVEHRGSHTRKVEEIEGVQKKLRATNNRKEPQPAREQVHLFHD